MEVVPPGEKLSLLEKKQMVFPFVRIKIIDSPEAAEDPEQVMRCICGEGNPWRSNLRDILSES